MKKSCPYALLSLLAILPLILFEKHIRKLFWFGDEFDLLNEFSGLGSYAILTPFAENFCPLFKLVWFQSVFWLDGQYFWIIAISWLIHVIIVLVFYKLLTSAGFDSFVSIFSASIFGIIPTNIETLTWSVQMSATLSMFFFVLGCHFQLKASDFNKSLSTTVVVGLFMCALLSALSFSRGVLTGVVYFWHTLVVSKFSLHKLRKKILALLACLIPPAIVSSVIIISSQGNHSALSNLLESYWGVVHFGLFNFFLNPILMMLNLGCSNDALNIVVGVSKTLIILAVLSRVDPKQRNLLLLLLIFDVGNSLLLGVGRFHTGLPAAISSRYQYASLICFLPFLGCFIQLILCVFKDLRIKHTLHVFTIVLFATISLIRWNSEINSWVKWRGQEIREELKHNSLSPDSKMAPCVPESMKLSKAKEIIEKFHLK